MITLGKLAVVIIGSHTEHLKIGSSFLPRGLPNPCRVKPAHQHGLAMDAFALGSHIILNWKCIFFGSTCCGVVVGI